MKSVVTATKTSAIVVDPTLWTCDTKYSATATPTKTGNLKSPIDNPSSNVSVKSINQTVVLHPNVCFGRQLNSTNSIDAEMTHFKPIRLMPISGRNVISKILKIPTVRCASSKENQNSLSPIKSKFKPDVAHRLRRSAFCLVTIRKTKSDSKLNKSKKICQNAQKRQLRQRNGNGINGNYNNSNNNNNNSNNNNNTNDNDNGNSAASRLDIGQQQRKRSAKVSANFCGENSIKQPQQRTFRQLTNRTSNQPQSHKTNLNIKLLENISSIDDPNVVYKSDRLGNKINNNNSNSTKRYFLRARTTDINYIPNTTRKRKISQVAVATTVNGNKKSKMTSVNNTIANQHTKRITRTTIKNQKLQKSN